MDPFAALASFDALLPDGLLLALAGAPGVDRDSIVIRPKPRPGRHGHVTVTWTQDARSVSREGSTLDIALRRAVRAAGAVSATPEAAAEAEVGG